MSGMASPQPPSPVAGAVNGMAPQQNPMAARFQTVVTGIRDLIKVASAMPGIDQEKLQQSVQMMQQAVQLFASALPKADGAAPPGAPPSPGPGTPG